MQRQAQIQPLADDRYEDIDRHSNPDLALDGVGRGAEEALDTQVLLDPLEEQLDLAPLTVQLADREGGQREMIGQEHQMVALGVAIADAAQPLGIAALGVEHDQVDDLIADQPGASIDGARVLPPALEIGFGPDDKEA